MKSIFARRAVVLAGLLWLLASAAVMANDVKIMVDAEAELPSGVAAELLADYGSFQLYRLDQADGARATAVEGIHKLDNADWLLFDAHPFDTQTDRIRPPAGWTLNAPVGSALQMIQFVGPIRQQWLDEVAATGAMPIHYVANHGYLVWADADARAQLDQLAAARSTLQFSAPYPSFFKLGPVMAENLVNRAGSETLPVTIQMIRHDGDRATQAFIAQRAQGKALMDWSPILGFQTARFELSLDDIAAIAERPDVYWIEEYLPRELMDEVQNQIVAGNFNGDQSGPSAPGYLSFLTGLGFSTDPADYPTVVVVDDGVGNGTVNSGDPTLHEFGNDANPTRLEFVTSCHSVTSGQGDGGHGHINTSIVGGYDDRSGFPFQFPSTYQRGQGINPWASLASTRIFAPSYNISGCGGTDSGVIQHTWQQGARISTNSWGCSGCAGSYDDGSQAYDAGVRDADPSTALNQELMVLFAAGNSGSGNGTIGTPGNGKNMLTVGASENNRPVDENGNWSDGCGVGPTGADDAMDVINFSSRGPAPGGRTKPETIAPGTHIQGTASTGPSYNGSGVCDQYAPSGQTIFAASSGTSHSTPAVAGVASLTWHWLENAGNILPFETPANPTPSPALIKAYILAHPTYLTGVSAGDTLPSNVQGYGMPNMGDMFDDTLKATLNQEIVFDNTGDFWEMTVGVPDPSKPVRVMMVYTDQPGAIGTSPQVNNLDLVVENGGDTYLGNRFSGQWSVTGGGADQNNNYEAVFLQPGTASAITVRVTAANIAGDGVPNFGDGTDQDFALVCNNCVLEPTFTLNSDVTDLSICTPDDAVYNLAIGSIEGFVDPVDLAISGEPAGASATFGTNPVTPAGGSVLTIGNTGAVTAGSYSMLVSASSGATVRELSLGLSVFTDSAGATSLTAPADGALGVSQSPVFEWSAASQASEYLIEVADSSDFANIVYSATVAGTSHTPGVLLPSNSILYWRVSPANLCGGSVSDVFSFATEALPGDCGIGTSANVLYSTGFEAGVEDWTTGGTGSTWAIQSGVVNTGT
ncbi:S8 family serine peptidase, partial [Wenzhouxiangella marina]